MPLPKAGTIEVAPSILSANFAKLADEIQQVEAAGVNIVHLDVMDGHFVPNITIGPLVIAKLRECTDLAFDAHLMITDPRKYAQAFVDAGVDHITFHIEVEKEPADFINRLHDMGVGAGVCINPDTDVLEIENVAPLCDMILVMTVNPGFGGQKFMADAAKKIIKVREIVGPEIRVQVDGGISPDNSKTVVSYGADTLVAGNAIFSKDDRVTAVKAILDNAK